MMGFSGALVVAAEVAWTVVEDGLNKAIFNVPLSVRRALSGLYH